jgi:hypothetical protein|tara:strand:- start:427 stop:573 length:147 start_codon:yes stop_codon:yes gene_type:complete
MKIVRLDPITREQALKKMENPIKVRLKTKILGGQKKNVEYKETDTHQI